MDLRVERAVLETKHRQLVELARDLARCEPRVVSLQEAADQLELQADSPACKQVHHPELGVITALTSGEEEACPAGSITERPEASCWDLHHQPG